MFLFQKNIATGLAAFAMFSATAVFGLGDEGSPVSGQNTAATAITSPTATAGTDVAAAGAVSGVDATSAAIESARAIKLRSGSGDPKAGNEKSQLCQGCHGEFGNSTAPLIPKLAGQYGRYIIKQALNYEAGTRTHQIMNAMVGTIENDEDLADIAAYFASQKKMKGKRVADNQLGKFIYLNGSVEKGRIACINCHGVWGKGLDAKTAMFPVIGGQHKEYIRKQLLDFRKDIRTNSPGNVMNIIAKSLTDAELDAVSEYVSTR